MNTIKKINKLLGAEWMFKNALLKGLENSFGNNKLNIVRESITFISSLSRSGFL
ncbi:hypothetical protein [Borreliella turdi]|uniref:hypothetical protein n=1 Tax=Borreliella turdi TaxID=57863 RepID=UPI001F2341FE|nr:hypothetical protein [Borreliella turdi]